jgi:siroheme synthase-like protein
MPAYPIELELRGRTVVVVGFGAVGRRKAEGLAAAGARVVAVDPAGRRDEVPAGVELVAESYRADHLQGASLVIAAAVDEVNHQVVADARRAGIWVGSASAPEDGDFSVPAIWRDGPLLVTVSTAGASPALAAVLRDRAAEAIGPAAGGLLGLLAELRPQVLARIDNPSVRRNVLTRWADPKWLELCESEGAEAVRRELVRMIDAAIDRTPLE